MILDGVLYSVNLSFESGCWRGETSTRKIVVRGQVISDEKIRTFFNTYCRCCVNIREEERAERDGLRLFNLRLQRMYGEKAAIAAPFMGGYNAEDDHGFLRLDRAAQLNQSAISFFSSQSRLTNVTKKLRYFLLAPSQAIAIEEIPRDYHLVLKVKAGEDRIFPFSIEKVSETVNFIIPALSKETWDLLKTNIIARLHLLNKEVVEKEEVLRAILGAVSTMGFKIQKPRILQYLTPEIAQHIATRSFSSLDGKTLAKIYEALLKIK